MGVNIHQVVLLDVDDVVLDFSGSLCKLAGLERGQIDQWALSALPGFKDWGRKLSEPDFWRNLEPCEGAVDMVDRLQQYGLAPVFVTSSYDSCAEWGSIRRKILNAMFGYLPLVITREKYLVNGRCLVDDRPENLRDWMGYRGAAGLGILKMMPHNATVAHQFNNAEPNAKEILACILRRLA